MKWKMGKPSACDNMQRSNIFFQVRTVEYMVDCWILIPIMSFQFCENMKWVWQWEIIDQWDTMTFVIFIKDISMGFSLLIYNDICISCYLLYCIYLIFLISFPFFNSLWYGSSMRYFEVDYTWLGVCNVVNWSCQGNEFAQLVHTINMICVLISFISLNLKNSE